MNLAIAGRLYGSQRFNYHPVKELEEHSSNTAGGGQSEACLKIDGDINWELLVF